MTPLADFLIARHINVSIPDQDLELRRSMLVDAPNTWQRAQSRSRCIAVVGAGASSPVLERGDDLAKSLMQQFNINQNEANAEREKLRRITAVDPKEFEAQLAAIGATVGDARRVRTAIAELYNIRHPTVQAYELIAHLLKHRFLDAVISMNFDELLDQSLEDELGVGEYQRIVSDRDCINIQTDPEKPDYIPLFIKLHGTASEPESLRFTRESYYDSPVGVGTVTAELFDIPECVVMNVGFGMGSFDLHRLLASPEYLWLFDLSKIPLEGTAKGAIAQEREEKDRIAPVFYPATDEIPPAPAESDEQMQMLVSRIEERGTALRSEAPSVLRLRSVKRHDVVVRLLGPDSGPGRKLIGLPRGLDDARFSVDHQVRAAKPNAAYADYLWRRAILELAMALARGHGLVSVGALALDRGGHYFDAYRRYAGSEPNTWRDLYTLVGFEQDEQVPDIFQATNEVRGDSEERGKKWHVLPDLVLSSLVKRILPHVVDSPSAEDGKALVEALEDLERGAEYEIHSRDDRVCEKTFFKPLTLKTISAHHAYSFELIRLAAENAPNGKVDIIAETGDWLWNRSDVAEEMKNAGQIRLIVAFTTDVKDLRDRFPNMEITQQQPWQHNRHMVIVKSGDELRRALYFARHHRTPYVTPVLVRRHHDIRVLETTFTDRWNKSEKVP
jgi:hypothetical protein